VIDATDPSVYGPIGLVAGLAITAVVKLYRDRERDRKLFAKQLAEERAACEKERGERLAEMRLLEERYVTKAETWMNQYQEFSKAATAVVDAAMKRYRRDGSRRYDQNE
jgi:hypothetical protein